MNTFFVNAFLVASFGLLGVHAQSSTFNGTAEMEKLQATFFKIEGEFEAAKSAQNINQFDSILEEIQQLKAQLVTFRGENQKSIDEVADSFFWRIHHEVDQLGSFKLDEAATWIADEILGNRSGINPLVQRDLSPQIQAAIGSALQHFGVIKSLGIATQTLVDSNERIASQVNFAKIIDEADKADLELVHAYQKATLKYNFQQNTKDLRFNQKYLLARFLNMFTYISNYVNNYRLTHLL